MSATGILNKVRQLEKLLEDKYGLTLLTGIEQELKTQEEFPISFDALRSKMYREAERMLTGSGDLEVRGRKMIDALSLAMTREHLFIIAVYDSMHGKVEHRDTPDCYGKGYYDMPGNIEFRTVPSKPLDSYRNYLHLKAVIDFQRKKFGLIVRWRSEQLNVSIWRGLINITGATDGEDWRVLKRALVGMLECNEEIKSLLRGLSVPYDAEVSIGPTRLDSIRIVCESLDSREHRIECRDVLLYGNGRINLPYRLLTVVDGISRAIDNAEYENRLKAIYAVSLCGIDRHHVAELGLEETWRCLSRLEADADGAITNIDEQFERKDTFLYGRSSASSQTVSCGQKIVNELAKKTGISDVDFIKEFFRSIIIADSRLILPIEDRFKPLRAKVAMIGVDRVRIRKSLRYLGVLIADAAERSRRLSALTDRWGSEVIREITLSGRLPEQVLAPCHFHTSA